MNELMQLFNPAAIGGVLAQLQSEIQDPGFWVALTKIMWINVLLSGDNALVIALACRGLDPRQRVWGMVLGAGVAVLLRIIFTVIVVSLMALPFLKLAGGLALLVIAAKMLVPDDPDENDVATTKHLWGAVRIVAIADIVMSLDNVIAVAAAANGSLVLLVLSLVISIPIIVAGAAIIMALLDRLPILVWLGAALLGWIAGEVIATDPAVQPVLHQLVDGQMSFKFDATSAVLNSATSFSGSESAAELILGLLGIAVVLAGGVIWRRYAGRLKPA